MKTGAAALACLLGALASCGCAPVDTSASGPADWRPAQIVAIGSFAELAASAGLDCGPGDGSAPYVVVRYHSSGVHSRSIGTGHVSPGIGLRVGDIVLANIRDCRAPLR